MNSSIVVLIPLMLIPVFSFVAVVVWVDARRKEREAQYRSETIKKITEAHGGGSAVEFLHEERKVRERRLREELKLGGVVTIAVGAALMIFLAAIDRSRPDYLVGLIPVFLGGSLLTYALLLAPKD